MLQGFLVCGLSMDSVLADFHTYTRPGIFIVDVFPWMAIFFSGDLQVKRNVNPLSTILTFLARTQPAFKTQSRPPRASSYFVHGTSANPLDFHVFISRRMEE